MRTLRLLTLFIITLVIFIANNRAVAYLEQSIPVGAPLSATLVYNRTPILVIEAGNVVEFRKDALYVNGKRTIKY